MIIMVSAMKKYLRRVTLLIGSVLCFSDIEGMYDYRKADAQKWLNSTYSGKSGFVPVKPPKIEPIESSYSEIQKRKQKKEEKHIRETNEVEQNYILGKKFRS